MDKFTEKLQTILIPISQKISQNKILKGITGGFSAMLPVTMVGAIFTLLANLNFEFYQNIITSIGLKSVFALAADYTTNMIALYAVFLIARAEALVIGMESEDAIASGVMALMFFLILIPLGEANAVALTFLGAAGLFTAMIVGTAIPWIHYIFVKNHITIKMPDSVPPMISKSFAALIPACAIALLACLLRKVGDATEAGSITMLIYNVLRAPLAKLGNSPFTMLVLLLICNLLWFFGIHGGMVTMPIQNMLYMQLTNENMAAFAAGETLPNIVTGGAWFGMGNIGGSGCAIGLCLCILLFAKSAQYKALKPVSTPAGLCAISEPMVFGVPMVLNPIMLIPMLLAPTVTFTLGYLAMASGLVPYMAAGAAPSGTPVLLSALFTWGDIRGLILQLVLIAVSTLIYFPFFKMADNQALKTENGEAE